MAPKIVISDIDFDTTEHEQAMCAAAGVELEIFEDRDADAIIANAHDADAILTSYGNFPARLFEALPNLKCVSRTGIGYDTIDVEAATKNRTAVCVVPGYGTEVVSDHAITLALCVLRRLNEIDADMRNGIWNFAAHRPLGQSKGRVFGVVGMGAIGQATAHKAAGLGFEVICHSGHLQEGTTTDKGYRVVSLEDLLRESDVVSLNCALTEKTHHLINEETLKLMKPGAVIVNTARGAVIDTVALARALEEGRLWGAGLDVYESEPIDFDHPIMKAPHTVLTSHAAYWSEESGLELRTRAMQAAIDAVQGRQPVDCLNPEVFD